MTISNDSVNFRYIPSYLTARMFMGESAIQHDGNDSYIPVTVTEPEPYQVLVHSDNSVSFPIEL